jgi:hypothetical protein
MEHVHNLAYGCTIEHRLHEHVARRLLPRSIAQLAWGAA